VAGNGFAVAAKAPVVGFVVKAQLIPNVVVEQLH